MTALRVTIADDGLLFREGLARILADGGVDVLAQYADGAALVQGVRDDRPDVAIIDLRMPPTHSSEGLDAAAEIRAFAPGVGLLILSQHVEVHHALRLMTDFGHGVGYLLKDRVADLTAFVVDVRRVGAGEVVIDPELVSRLVARGRQHDPVKALTERERAVLSLMAQGLSNSAVADALSLSVKTVESHVRHIFITLGLELDEREHRRVLAVLAFLRS